MHSKSDPLIFTLCEMNPLADSILGMNIVAAYPPQIMLTSVFHLLHKFEEKIAGLDSKCNSVALH